MHHVLILLVFVRFIAGETSSAIPSLLLNCYRDNVTDSLPRPPLTTKLLIELIRKLEADKSDPHIRILTNAILHSVTLDGVVRGTNVESEDVVPFRAIGKQFYKFKFLVDHLTPGDALQFPKDALNHTDLCILHYIISSSIGYEERGKGRFTCSMEKDLPVVNERPKDICVLEKGVIDSGWGPVSPGHLIAGIASALQKETVSVGTIFDDMKRKSNFSEETREQRIDNVWAATIAGDLAEVLINQGKALPKLGSNGYWNDSLLPRNHYLDEDNWDMTDAELLGGVDAMILASRVKEWVSSFEKVRLSQLIDMYYSGRGIAFDRSYRACQRTERFKEVLNEINLEEQVSGTAKSLQNFERYGVMMSEDAINSVTPGVVETYKKFAEALFSKYEVCHRGGDNIGRLEIIAILDETWSQYQTEKFIAYLSEKLDVSYYGSKLGLINGENGAWMTNITSDLVELYTEMSSKAERPTRLSLTRSLNTVVEHYQNKIAEDEYCRYLRPQGRVVIIMAQSTVLSENDRRESENSLRTLGSSHPEARVLFVAPELSAGGFKELKEIVANGVLLGFADDDVGAIVGGITKALDKYPASIVNFYCNDSTAHFEDYISPGLETFYEIREEYAARAKISVKFKGNGYGDISVCAYDAESMAVKTCKDITVNSEVTFNIEEQCTSGTCSVQFAVLANSSALKCSEFDCRYPDQLRLDIFTMRSKGTNRCNGCGYLIILLIAFYVSVK